MITDYVQRFTNAQRIWKINFLLFLSVIVAIGILPSFGIETDAPRAVSATQACGAKVSLVLDRSASIGVDAFSGSRANSDRNVTAVKNGAAALVDSLKGSDSYTDLHAFASVSQRINTGGWLRINTDDSANLQKWVIGGTTFKRGANSGDQDAYNDGINAAGEGLTNWEHALSGVENFSNYIGLPTHVVIFTDGEPTTNTPNANRAIAAGGSYGAAGLPNEDGVSPDDLNRAFTVADRLRSKGVKIIAVGVGDIIKPNLDRLAGGASNVYLASSFSQLEQKFQQAAENICTADTTLFYKAVEKVGNTYKPIRLPIRTSVQPASNAGVFNLTTTGQSGGNAWVYKTFKQRGAWDFRATATIPEGYRAVEDNCRRDGWDENRPNNKPLLNEVGGTAADQKEVLVQGNAPGGWTLCEFVVEKINYPDSSIAVRVREKDGNTYTNFAGNVNINIPGSIDNQNVTTSTTGNGYVTRTFNRSNAFNYHLTLSAPAGYTVLPEDKCAISGQNQSDTIPDNNQFRGVNAVVGSAVQCEFVIEKLDAGLHAAAYIPGEGNNDVSGPSGISYVRDPQNDTFSFDGQEDVSTPTQTADFVVESGENGDLVIEDRADDDRSLVGVTCRSGGLDGDVITNGITPIYEGVRLSSSALIGGTETYCQFFFAKAQLDIIKTVNGQDAPQNNPLAVRIGDALNYSFEITNTGEIPVEDISLTDTNLVSRRSDALSDCLSDLNGETLDVGESFECDARVIAVPVDAEGVIRNIAKASGTGVTANSAYPGPEAPEVQDDANVKVTRPIISIEKNVSPSILTRDGQTVTYTIKVTNTGDASFTGIIEDAAIGYSKSHTVPAANGNTPGSITITIKGTFNASNETLVFTKAQNPDLASDKTISLTSGTFTNSACVKAINLCDDAKVDVADLTIVKDAVPSSILVGENGKYVIRVTNTGKVALVNVTISDDTLKNLFENADDGVNDNNQTTFAINDDEVTCSISDDSIFTPGETCVVEIDYTMTEELFEAINDLDIASPIQFTNTAKVVGTPVTGTDEDELTRTDDATITVVAEPALEIDKKVSSTIVSQEGDTVTYTITVTNTGSGAADDVTIYERGLDVEFGPFDIPGASQAPNNKVVITIVATFDGDNTLTFRRDGQVIATKQFTNGVFENIACLEPNGDDPCSPEVEVYKPGLRLVKNANADDYVVGEDVTYTFALTNTGATAIGNVELEDDTIADLFDDANETPVPDTSFTTDDFTGDVNNNNLLDKTETWTTSVTFELTEDLYEHIQDNDSNDQVDGFQFHNIAVAEGDTVPPGTTTPDPSKPVGPVEDDEEITVKAGPALLILKEVSTPVVVDGEEFTYTITATNPGDADATNVTITDDLAGFTETIAVLPAGESRSFELDAVVDGNEIKFSYNGQELDSNAFFGPNGNFINVACGTSDQGEDCSPEVEVKTPKIALDKRVRGSDTVHIGETVTYRFRVTNVNEVPVKDLVITDETLKDLFGLSQTPTINIPNSNLGSDGVLTQGETSSFVEFTTPEITQEIAEKFDDNVFVNTAVVNGKAVLPDGTTKDVDPAEDDARINLELRPGWTFEKTVEPKVARPGDTVTYKFSVTNTGETVIPSITVEDDTINKTLVIDGPINPGETKFVTTTFEIPEDFEGTIFENEAQACITDTDDCKESEEEVYIPSIRLDKTGPTVAKAGDTVTYTFTVTNTGETDLTNLVITDETLSDLLGEEVEIEVPGILEKGETSDPIEFEFEIPEDFDEDAFTNIAIVTGDPIDPETDTVIPDKPVEDDDDHTITLIKWHAEKTADRTAAAPGDTVEYTITVFNDGTVALSDVEVSDSTIGFPANGEPVKVDIPVGGKVEVKATYTIPEDFEGETFRNVALVCVPRAGQDEDCETPEEEIPIVDIDVEKTADKDVAVLGEEITYTFKVTNNGNADLTNVRVVDVKLGFDETIPSLEIGETVTLVADSNKYVVTQADIDAGEIENVVTACASVPGEDGDCTPPEIPPGEENPGCVDRPNTICDDDTVTVPVGNPDIAVTKDADATTADLGQTVTYTFVITNPSDIVLRDVEVVDNVLGDLGTIDSLDPGESVTKTATFVANTVGTIRNIVTACFNVPEVVDNCASDDHTLTVTDVGGETVTRVGGISQLAFTGSLTDKLVKAALWLTLIGSGFVLISKRPRKNKAL